MRYCRNHMAERNNSPEFVKKTPKLPEELQGIPLSKADFELEKGKERRFRKVILGDIDVDTVVGYCIARSKGIIDKNTEVVITNREVPAEEINDPAVLTIEASLPAVAGTISVERLQEAKETLLSLGLPTTEIEKRIADAQTQTPQQERAKRGIVSHTGTEQYCAAAQLFALTGADPRLAHIAAYAQRIEVTRRFPRVKKAEIVGPTFVELMYAVIEKHKPHGGIKKEQIAPLLDELQLLFEHTVSQQEKILNGIAVGGTPFTSLAETIEKKRMKQSELLEQIKIEQRAETSTGIRVVLVNGTESDRGAFGKLNTLFDENGRALAEVTVLKGADGKIMISVHKSLQSKRIDLLQLASILNAEEIAKDEIVLDTSNQFGGHDVKEGKAKSQIIGSPRETGTTLKPEHVYDVVFEYIDQQRYTKEELEAFAERQGWKGVLIVPVEGSGAMRVPELCIRYVDTKSAAATPELSLSGVYKKRVRVLKESQLNLAEGRIMTDTELFEGYLKNGQADRALKILERFSATEREALLGNEQYRTTLWQRIISEPRFLRELYCPLTREYFSTHPDKNNAWIETTLDKATASYLHPHSGRFIFDTMIINGQRNTLTSEEYSRDIQQMLLAEPVREEFSQGRIFGRLLTEAFSIATNTQSVDPYTQWNAQRLQPGKVTTAEQQNMIEWMMNTLSTEEVRYLRQLIEEKIQNTPVDSNDTHMLAFVERLRPFITALKKREDWSAILEQQSQNKTSIERKKDSHHRKVVVLEIGRQANMVQNVERTIQEYIPGKQSWNVAIRRGEFLGSREALLDIVRETIEEIQTLATENETTEIDLYAQCPISVLGLIAYECGQQGVKANFGQWINGQYQLFTPAEIRELKNQNHPVFTLLHE